MKAKNGWTTIHCATRKGHIHIIQVLEEMGVDILANDTSGRTARQLAEQFSHWNASKILKEMELVRKTVMGPAG